MANITLENIKKSFGKTEVIHDISLEIENGSFVALVGPSGCGKSTLLRMIAGLTEITEGNIKLDGQVVNDLTPRKRNIAMVFQSYALYPHMSVAENIGFNLKLNRIPKSEIKERVAEVAKLLDIEHLLDRKPVQLSGGQRQRVAMGRAIIRDPRAFLFDEPLSNLDAKLRVQMRTEIKALHRKMKTTSVYVTHDQVEAMTLSDRIVVLNKGYIEQIGAPLELYNNPANPFVASFIGSPSMNLVEGQVQKRDGNVYVAFESGVSLKTNRGSKFDEGQPVTIGIRPEHLRPGQNGNSIEADVTDIEHTGAISLAQCSLNGTSLTLAINHTDIGNSQFAGKQVLSVDPELVYVFER